MLGRKGRKFQVRFLLTQYCSYVPQKVARTDGKKSGSSDDDDDDEDEGYHSKVGRCSGKEQAAQNGKMTKKS